MILKAPKEQQKLKVLYSISLHSAKYKTFHALPLVNHKVWRSAAQLIHSNTLKILDFFSTFFETAAGCMAKPT